MTREGEDPGVRAGLCFGRAQDRPKQVQSWAWKRTTTSPSTSERPRPFLFNQNLIGLRSRANKIIELSRGVVTAPASNGTTPIGCRSSFRKLLIQRSFSCDLGRCLSQAEAEFPGLAM